MFKVAVLIFRGMFFRNRVISVWYLGCPDMCQVSLFSSGSRYAAALTALLNTASLPCKVAAFLAR